MKETLFIHNYVLLFMICYSGTSSIFSNFLVIKLFENGIRDVSTVKHLR